LERVVEALSTAEEPKLWTYHMAVEVGDIDGQLFIRGGDVFYSEDGPNFKELIEKAAEV